MDNVGQQLEKTFKENNLFTRYEALINQALEDKDVQAFIAENQDQLAPDFLKTDGSKLYEYVQVKQKIANNEPVFIPGYSPLLKLSDHHIEIIYTPTVELLQQRKIQEIEKRFTLVNMTKSVRNATLDNYDRVGRVDNLTKVLKFYQEYLIDSQKFHKGIYLHGKFGVGKTYLLAALANKLARAGFEPLMVHFPSFAVELKNSIGTNKTKEMVEKVKKAQILIIDDIGADQLNNWIRDDILGVILQYRMQEELPTFFTSNYNMEELETKYLAVNSKGEFEPVKAKRIMERIRFLAQEDFMGGENRRNPN